MEKQFKESESPSPFNFRMIQEKPFIYPYIDRKLNQDVFASIYSLIHPDNVTQLKINAHLVKLLQKFLSCY